MVSKRHIVIWPDSRLSEKSLPVDKFDESLHELLDDMTAIMLELTGLGLAAPQVGELKRIVLISDKDGEIVEMINPEITSGGNPVDVDNEGCLSFPGEGFNTVRFNETSVKYLDRYGMPQTLDASGLVAIEIQHEVDHLDGKLLISTVSNLKKDMIKRRLIKLKKKLFGKK